MKKFFASLLAIVGVTSVAQPQAKVTTIDSNKILFSIATLAGDIPPLEPGDDAPNEGDLVLHEDDWTQIEFFPKARLEELKRVMTEYMQFEQANRVASGWRRPYIRKIERSPILGSTTATKQLATDLGVNLGPAVRLSSAGRVYGRVGDSFTLPLGGNVTLYGLSAKQDIAVLAASVGRNPDDYKLTRAFMTLNAAHNLILVDWRSKLILVSVTSKGQIETWSP